MKVLALRRDDTCTRCAAPLPAGTRAYWDAAARETVCAPCLEGATVPDQPAAPSIEQPADSAAGASA
ncbi:MAG: hypothetical protein QOG99_2421, partial [Frankiales bacterium]|nr:hypothetical protein [Frankiales bacterium]